MIETDVLTARIATNSFIEFCRYLVAFTGLVHLLFAVSRLLTHQAFWSGMAFAATGLLTMLQQTEAVGDQLVPWRLPLYAVMNVAGIIFLYKLGPRGRERECFPEPR